jgi:hypothetical protein
MKISTFIITALAIGIAAILMIMYVSNFMTTVILNMQSIIKLSITFNLYLIL